MSEAGRPALFRREVKIRFSHCDPAGIVYFPHYFDMMNGVVEDWFAEQFPDGFAGFVMSERRGLPIVHAECDFVRPSAMGDTITLSMTVERIGERSITFRYQGEKNGEEILRARIVMVSTSLETHTSLPIPGPLRQALERYRAAAGPANDAGPGR